jgi:hypothetical protein
MYSSIFLNDIVVRYIIGLRLFEEIFMEALRGFRVEAGGQIIIRSRFSSHAMI